MNIDNEIISTDKMVRNLETAGYSKAEAIELIQAAALAKLAECVNNACNGKTYLNITGNVATYEK